MVPLRNETYKKFIINQEPNSDMKLTENTFDRIYNLNDLISCSSQVLCLPENMTKFTKELTELEITNNDFTQISQLLSLIENLKKLIINNTLIKSIPNQINELHNLQILNLSRNQLKELPESLTNIKTLESLNLSFNQLEDLPISYRTMQRLKELDISNNKFDRIPACIANGMGTLKSLDVSENEKIKLNIIPHSKYLEKFYARKNNNCRKFPDWILHQKFFNLKEVNLDNTQFDYYSFVTSKNNLNHKFISMNCSNLSSPVLQMMIEFMVNLEIINVGNKNKCNVGNVFNSIPVTVLRNPQLITELNFRATGLPALPNAINKLTNLKVLDVGMNCISWFPEEICELQKLESVKVDENNLIMLPNNIGNIKSLQEIQAQGNILGRLPESLKNLKNLKLIDVYNNQFREFPNVILKMNNLKSLDLEQNYFITDDFKIEGISYSVLRENYVSCLEDIRPAGHKQRKMSISDDEKPDTSYFSDEEEDSNLDVTCNDPDENWDTLTDSNDEFDPESIKELNNKGKYKDYIAYQPLGFCPADLHSSKIKAEVATMRIYGSLPLFKIEQGQFDDA